MSCNLTDDQFARTPADLEDDNEEEERDDDSSSSLSSPSKRNSEELLLSDVDAALRLIVSESDHQQQEQQQQEKNKDDNDNLFQRSEEQEDVAGTPETAETPTTTTFDTAALHLSDPQLISLRQLSQRLQRWHERQQKSIRKVVTGSENTRVRDHAKHLTQSSGTRLKQRVRKVVTGSSERALSDWVQETKVVKAVDKFAFMLGLSVLLITEYVGLRQPQQFGNYYVVLISTMMALRFYMYAKSRYLYFLLDFCYFANASCFVNLLLYPNCDRLWRLNYANSLVLLGAMLAWRNSLVFHSLDKVTSIAIHFLPSLLIYIERWCMDDDISSSKKTTPSLSTFRHTKSTDLVSLGWRGAFVEPLAFYFVWQLLYIVKTEIVDRKSLQADPSIQTSLRWLSRDAKNPMNVVAKRVCRATGVLGPREEFQPESWKTKLVFWTGQMLFTLCTLLPAPLLFRYRDLHTAYILLVLAAALYNGSNYYFEVFAARYIQQLEAKQAAAQNHRRSRTGAETTGPVPEELDKKSE